MNKKAYEDAKSKLEEYAKEIRTRKGHLSQTEKQKLLRKARQLWMNVNSAEQDISQSK